jgi:hypothetical protein
MQRISAAAKMKNRQSVDLPAELEEIPEVTQQEQPD